MSHVMNYQPARYHHIKEEDFYIDHHAKKSFWKRMKQQMLEGTESMDAKMKTIFDKRLRASLQTSLVRQYLRGVGLNNFDLLKPETFAIAKLLHKDEAILGAIVGRLDEGGSAFIVVTDLRVIYLNQIPLFTRMDEVGYGTVTGVTSRNDRLGATVTLHTGIGDFTLRNVNKIAAKKFVDAVERVAIDNQDES